MEFFKPENCKVDFFKYFGVAKVVSLCLTLACVGLIIWPGLNYGIDFRGGVEARVALTDKNVSQKDLRDLLDSKLQNVSIVNFSDGGNNEFLITAQSDSKDSIAKILGTTLTDKYGPEGQAWNSTKMDVVGPKVGSELRKSAILSLIYTCLLIALYMYWRFDVRFTPGVLACILHDILMTCGFLVLTRAEFSTSVVAALLTLAGYSVNDTVVVFDRIRELGRKYGGRNQQAMVNEAINSTLSRTTLTAGTTMVSCLVLYFLGGPTLKDFSLALFFGIVVGTYSSIFVSTPLYVWADKKFGQADKALSHAKV